MTDIIINDGLWHFVCVTWSSSDGLYEIFLDGTLYVTGMNLSTGSSILGGGSLTIGQEQDGIGTGFSETESFIGSMTYLDIWNYTLTARDIQEYYMSCEPYFGNLIPWTSFKINIKGDIQVLSSDFCQACPTGIYLENGYIRILDNKAFYFCNEGYILQGSSPRYCLRTSMWKEPPPFCRAITCESVKEPNNGFVRKVKSNMIEEVHYTCIDGYILDGPSVRTCLPNGTWTGMDPECSSIVHCSNINTIDNSIILYVNDKGPLNEDFINYPVGTLAEIQCLDDIIILGESLLTCLESGKFFF